MIRHRITLAAIATVATALIAVPATAQQLAVDDATGDASRSGLDITSATVANRDSGILATVSFAEVKSGRLIVSIDRRRGRGVALVSTHRPGPDRDFVVRGSFTDKKIGRRLACRGFSVTWDDKADTARLRLPARCLHRGNYGAVRFAVLTEQRTGGGDVDYAPQTRQGDIGSSAWVPRG